MQEDAKVEKTRICDVLKYEQDIKPYPLIKIYSGVGSGKSFFAANMITGSEKSGIPEQNVLIITSRRSKVEETLKELGVNVKERITKSGNLNFDVCQTGEARPEQYEKYLKEINLTGEWGDISYLSYNKSVVCTNAYISAYLRNIYNPDDPTTHIWNKFDSIVIDEIHSLVTDATYQAATFDVLCLAREYMKRWRNGELQKCACKHLILMTGTPQPFEYLANDNSPKEHKNELYLFEACENVVPKNVILIDKLTAHRRIRELLASKKKIIYFTNHTLRESTAREKFCVSAITNIGVTFSNEEKRKELSEDELSKIKLIDESLSNNSLIPENIDFFITTSRNKEGININNTDFQNMFIETHLMYDAVQMAGRVRSGVENLYIITNADQFDYETNITDVLFSKKTLVKNSDYSNSADEVNKYLKNEYLENENEILKPYEERRRNIMHYVKYIESRFAYIRYDVFNQVFKFFHVKENSEKLARTQLQEFKKMLLSDSNKMIETWFPKSTVKRELSVKEQGEIYLRSVIGEKSYVILSADEFKKHLAVILELFNSDLNSPNPILHLVDEKFNCKKVGNNYILYCGYDDPRVKKKPMKKRRKS